MMDETEQQQQEQENVLVFGVFDELLWYRISFADLWIVRHKEPNVGQNEHVCWWVGRKLEIDFYVKSTNWKFVATYKPLEFLRPFL